MADHDGYVVIVPDTRAEAKVCDLAQLVEALTAGAPWTDAVEVAAIDTLDVGDGDHFKRVAELNASGDAGPYWGL